MCNCQYGNYSFITGELCDQGDSSLIATRKTLRFQISHITIATSFFHLRTRAQGTTLVGLDSQIQSSFFRA